MERLEESCERWNRLLKEITFDPPAKFDLVQVWRLSCDQSKLDQPPAEVKEDDEEDLTKAKEVQTKLLRAVGSSKTVQELLIRDASYGRYGAGLNVLTPIEWELFFSKMQSNPNLRSVVIEGNESFYNTVIPHFTAYIAGSTTLENLRIGELLRQINVIPKSRICRLEEETVQALSDSLIQSKSLEFLQIGSVEVASIHILLRALTGSPRNQSIQCLEIDEFVGWLGYALPNLLVSENTTLKEIILNVLTCTELDVEQCSAIGCSLLQATSLERFTLVTDLRSPLDIKPTYNVQNAIDVMDELVKASRGSSILKFDMRILRDYMDTHLTSWLVKALSRYSNFDRLQFRTLRVGGYEIHELLPVFEALKSNFFLQSLSVRSINGEGGWKHLTECLQSNTTLKRLSFEDCSTLDDESFKSLMELLQVNISLENIDFGSSYSSSDGRAALVTEALKRNKAFRFTIETLGNAGLAFNGPKSGRLFLCGSALAGKTRLRMTMMKTRSKKSWLRKVVAASTKKTKGIEVEMLRDDDEMQVSIWDLAGQWIFRALQDLIFPRASQTCVFVFVFSPLDDNQEKVKPDLGQALRSELTSWLRFVASNSQITGHCIPHVLVVMTHKDKMDQQEAGWAKFIINDLQEKFKGVLDLHGGEELYYVDAQVTKEVQPLTEHILKLFEESMQRRSSVVPWVCSQLVSKLSKRPVEIVNCPVWGIDTLYSFFAQEMKALNAGSFDLRLKSERKVLEAMALYMHDVGSIVIIPNSDMVVVDINWLTHKVLGRLICQGHNNTVKDGSAHLSPDGFVAQFELRDILLKLWTKHRRQGITFDIRVLEDLLVKLDLCYLATSKKGENHFFIPSLFGKGESKQLVGATSQHSLEWTASGQSSDWGHFGFRLQCFDRERTLLTSAVFPRFQIHLRNKMISIGLDMVQENFDCAHDYIKLHVNGCFIILERGGVAGDHVDIMVRFSKLKQRERAVAMSFVKEHLLEEFRAYCASPKGCPGVALVVAIIRPECVRKLTPHLHRTSNQVVLVEELKREFTESVERNLKVTELDGKQWGEDNFLLDYQHSWPRVPQASLLPHSEPAIELLERQDLEEVVRAVRKRRENSLQEVRQVMDTLDASLGSSIAEKEKSGSAQPTVPPANPEEGPVEISLNERDAELVNLIMLQLDKQRAVDDAFSSRSLEDQVQGIRKDLAKVLSIQRELRSSLIHIMSKVDKMIGYTDALKKAKVPRRPFLTLDDMGFRKRLGMAVQFGTPVRLHLLCESQSGPHIIEKQPGWGVCVTKENKEWLRLISVNSLRIAWYLMKSKVDLVQPGPGPQALKEPEFSELGVGSKSALTVTDVTMESLKSRDLESLAPGDEMTSEAWTFLKNCLAAKFDYANDFKLHLVKYKAPTGSVGESHAWLCANCLSRGQRNGILTKVGQDQIAN